MTRNFVPVEEIKLLLFYFCIMILNTTKLMASEGSREFLL
jgi:hypothetical protein